MPNPLTLYGLTPVPASSQTLLTSTPAYPPPNTAPIPILVSDTPIPNTRLATRINAYAQAHLPPPTYHHSLRVYHYGLAIKRYRFPFPDWDFSDETYFLACVLHDIGTTEENLVATRLSFEFLGGFLALEVLQKKNHNNQNETEDRMDGGEEDVAPRDQAESVAEAIIRHQDLCTVGKITAVGQLLQLATIFGRLIPCFQAYTHTSRLKNEARARVDLVSKLSSYYTLPALPHLSHSLILHSFHPSRDSITPFLSPSIRSHLSDRFTSSHWDLHRSLHTGIYTDDGQWIHYRSKFQPNPKHNSNFISLLPFSMTDRMGSTS
jgi:cyanamide hydratase